MTPREFLVKMLVIEAAGCNCRMSTRLCFVANRIKASSETKRNNFLRNDVELGSASPIYNVLPTIAVS